VKFLLLYPFIMELTALDNTEKWRPNYQKTLGGNSMEKKVEGIYDGFKELGTGKMVVLGLQHVFAMFGATVLVPIICGMSISVTLFCAGIATIWFFFITKRKVPVFLGSSFAFIGAILGAAGTLGMPYATGGIVSAGLTYVIFALLFAIFGAKRIMRLFPPVVTGPIIMLIGLSLAYFAFNQASNNWWLAILTIIIVIAVNIWGKGMIKILPVLIGIFGAYIVACIVTAFGPAWVDFSGLKVSGISDIIAVPPFFLPKFDFSTMLTFIVVAIAALVEHIGDICAIGATCGKNFIADPGLTRTLLGDGIGTSIAGMLGGPANTTYSENTGVVALTRVYDPKVMFIAACFAIIFSFVSIFEAFVNTIPAAIIGGISIVLYGMITATGVRTIVENKVDFKNMRNVLVAALILVTGLGIQTSSAMGSNSAELIWGTVKIGTLNFSGLATAAIVGIIVNAILPGKDYVFNEEV
jgi:uracil permease